MKLHEDIYHIRATCLTGGKNEPYNIIAIEKYKSLTNLAEAILNAFGFKCNHAFGFYNNLKNWTNSKVCYEHFVDVAEEFAKDNAQSPNATAIEDMFTEINPVLFLFDYGDEWHFKVQLTTKTEPQKGVKYPAVTESKYKAPKQY